MSRISKEDFLESIRELGTDAYPTSTDYTTRGEYSQQLVYKWFESWGNAIEAAGYDYTGSRRNSPDSEIYRFTCINCDEEFRADVSNGTARCSHCGEHVNAYRSRLNFQGKNGKFYQQIASGPVFGTNTADINKNIAEKLEFPTKSSGSDVIAPTKERCIYYLPGDERRAATMFVEKFTEVVENEMRDTAENFLAMSLNDAMFNLIMEQYFWLHGAR